MSLLFLLVSSKQHWKIFTNDLLLPVHTQNYHFIWYQSLLPKCRGVHSMSLACFGSFISDKGHTACIAEWELASSGAWKGFTYGTWWREVLGAEGKFQSSSWSILSLTFGLSISALLRLKEMLSVNSPWEFLLYMFWYPFRCPCRCSAKFYAHNKLESSGFEFT